MRVLVTGGAGYVGSVSVEALIAAGHTVFVLDNLSRGHRAAVAPEAALLVADYGDPAAIAAALDATAPEAILHCGALSLVAESMAEPERYHANNVAGGAILLAAARPAGVRRLVFSSSAAVYGVPASVPIRESAPLSPINPYGQTKRDFEARLAAEAAGGLRSVSLRYFNVAGASERYGEDHDPETHLIPIVLAAAAGSGSITVFGTDYPTADGTCVRDYIGVTDLAAAHLAALEATAPGDPRTSDPDGAARAIALNLGSGGGFSVLEVLAAAERVTGRSILRRIGGRRAGDPPALVADDTLAHSTIGWNPAHRSLDEIIDSAWAWRQRHPSGYPR